MTKSRIQEIADSCLNQWFAEDPQKSTKTLSDHVCEAIQHALYEEGCRTGTGPRDANNPEFIRQCGPGGAYGQ